MPTLEGQIVIGISSSSLFDTSESHEVYVKEGKAEYIAHQLEREADVLNPGAAYPLIQKFLELNSFYETRKVEVVVMSQNEPAAGVRIMNSIHHHGLDISRSCYVGGEKASKYLDAFNVSLFLSRDKADVRAALKQGVAAGHLWGRSFEDFVQGEQLRIAFDADAVIFSNESEAIYQKDGIAKFWANEDANNDVPMDPGPFADFLHLISDLNKEESVSDAMGVRVAVVTARNSPADKRVLKTLRAYGIDVNEIFFMGGLEKTKVLQAFNPHIFFDDQELHVAPASKSVPSAHVVYEDDESVAVAVSADILKESAQYEEIFNGITKKDFNYECRNILKSYLPGNSRVLPDGQRDFIKKGSERSPEQRAKILDKLRRYDISSMNITPFSLNRESVKVETVLRKILDEQ